MTIDDLKRYLIRLNMKRAFSQSVRLRFYDKTAEMLANGKKIQNILDDLGERSGGVVARVLADVNRRIGAGQPLYQAISNYAPPDEVMLMQAGEHSGRHADMLRLAADSAERAQQVRMKVLGAMLKPLGSVLMVAGSLWIVGDYVTPHLAAVFPPQQWTGVPRTMYFASLFVNSMWFPASLVTLLVLLVVPPLSLPRWRGRGRVIADYFPPWSLYRIMVGSGWLLSLSAMLQSGVMLSTIIKQMRRNASPYLDERLSKMLAEIERGADLGSALHNIHMNFPDKEVVEDLMSYAELAHFDAITFKLGQVWSKKSLKFVERQALWLDVVNRIVFGLMVGWMAYAALMLQMQMGSHAMSFM